MSRTCRVMQVRPAGLDVRSKRKQSGILAWGMEVESLIFLWHDGFRSLSTSTSLITQV